MNSKGEAKPVARVPGRKTGAKGNPAPRLPSRAQPAYEELHHFFNESMDLLCIAGFDGRFKRLNPAWQPALGWTLAELQARPFLDFVHPDDRPASLAEMEKLATGGATITFENRYHCKDGSWKCLQWTAQPFARGAGDLRHRPRCHPSKTPGGRNPPYPGSRAGARRTGAA